MRDVNLSQWRRHNFLFKELFAEKSTLSIAAFWISESN